MRDQLLTIAEEFELLAAKLAELEDVHVSNTEVTAHLAVARDLVKSGLERIYGQIDAARNGK